ncbi:MAG TPA: hypothetical protein PLE10_02970 [Brevefilum sp.]|nr:hypothetical protein [Brevefilum sp.]HOR18776.1 hypothetical protein [Brevefilum sp.]HPL68677.1 hypothetical protein [Brevefilum sp.]
MLISIAGASSSGKSTLLNGFISIFGQDNVAYIDMDGYHFHTRQKRIEINQYPDEFEANDFTRLISHLEVLESGKSIIMPTYDHTQGTFGDSILIVPKKFIFIEGLHANYLNSFSGKDLIKFSIFVNPEEDLRRSWKVKRDVSKRGYSYSDAIQQIYKREEYEKKYIFPQVSISDSVMNIERVVKISSTKTSLLITDKMQKTIKNIIKDFSKISVEFIERSMCGYVMYEICFVNDDNIGLALNELLVQIYHRDVRVPYYTKGNYSYNKAVNSLALLISMLSL